MQVGAKTDVGRVRRHNEDGYAIRPPLFAVADGMGGHAAGEVASALALEALTLPLPAADPVQGLRCAIEEANRRILAAAARDRNLAGMGTTLTALYLAGGRAVVGHVGDSRLYLVRGDQIGQLTQDHSVVAELVRNGTLTEEEARRHPRRHVLTRALGTYPDVEIDVFEFPVQVGDTLVLCTDGLSGLLTPAEILELVANQPVQPAAEALVAAANERGGPDNITVLIVRLESEEDFAPVPAGESRAR